VARASLKAEGWLKVSQAGVGDEVEMKGRTGASSIAHGDYVVELNNLSTSRGVTE
jgi:hypothetical protein